MKNTILPPPPRFPEFPRISRKSGKIPKIGVFGVSRPPRNPPEFPPPGPRKTRLFFFCITSRERFSKTGEVSSPENPFISCPLPPPRGLPEPPRGGLRRSRAPGAGGGKFRGLQLQRVAADDYNFIKFFIKFIKIL